MEPAVTVDGDGTSFELLHIGLSRRLLQEWQQALDAHLANNMAQLIRRGIARVYRSYNNNKLFVNGMQPVLDDFCRIFSYNLEGLGYCLGSEVLGLRVRLGLGKVTVRT